MTLLVLLPIHPRPAGAEVARGSGAASRDSGRTTAAWREAHKSVDPQPTGSQALEGEGMLEVQAPNEA